MSKEQVDHTQEKTEYSSPNISEATEKDWEDFFAVQEENVFDR